MTSTTPKPDETAFTAGTTAGTTTPPKRPSGAQRRKAAQEQAPSSAKAAAGRRKSPDAAAIERAANELVGFAGLFLMMQGQQADAEVIARLGPDWCSAFADVVDKHPQLKRLLASGAGSAPELRLAWCTAQIVWAIRSNHPPAPKPKNAPSAAPAGGAGPGTPQPPDSPVPAAAAPSPDEPPAPAVVGVEGDVPAELVQLFQGFSVPAGPATEADQAAFLSHAARVHP